MVLLTNETRAHTMIELIPDDILRADAKALVNTVNCVGVMGRSVALQFERMFPKNFAAYAAACTRSAVQPGKMSNFETGQMIPPRFVVNFPTKRDCKDRSRIEDVDAGLAALVADGKRLGIELIAAPPWDAGPGNLTGTTFDHASNERSAACRKCMRCFLNLSARQLRRRWPSLLSCLATASPQQQQASARKTAE